ncbi:MAG: hypothetical protein GKS00_26455 [Alphaproteobacteria bacterium]|nr:hypothetical protein [Alphaproteobacteria bacterium]
MKPHSRSYGPLLGINGTVAFRTADWILDQVEDDGICAEDDGLSQVGGVRGAFDAGDAVLSPSVIFGLDPSIHADGKRPR